MFPEYLYIFSYKMQPNIDLSQNHGKCKTHTKAHLSRKKQKVLST